MNWIAAKGYSDFHSSWLPILAQTYHLQIIELLHHHQSTEPRYIDLLQVRRIYDLNSDKMENRYFYAHS